MRSTAERPPKMRGLVLIRVFANLFFSTLSEGFAVGSTPGYSYRGAETPLSRVSHGSAGEWQICTEGG